MTDENGKTENSAAEQNPPVNTETEPVVSSESQSDNDLLAEVQALRSTNQRLLEESKKGGEK